ncbi:MAG: hypothetical protein JWM87_4319 [Candidatus Eremiobacteraeota bacterium]|nr:hypothetical protein [Candidatus Eremiobacteraeota bacterium]
MATVRSMFTLDHADFICAPTVVELDRDHFWVTGGITTRDGRNAGSFTRRLVRRNFEWTAVHESLRIDPVFRRRRIAYSHYRKVLRAYRELGCYRVEMFAQDFGPFVWPQFGFRFRWPEDRSDIEAELDRLHRARTGLGLPTMPPHDFAIVAVESSSGEPIGAEATRTIALRHPNGALEMALDLRDPVTLRYLVIRGIFDVEEIR